MNNTKNDNAEAVRSSAWFGVGDLVITRIKNRWGLECAGTVEAMNGKTADVRVWNMNGPGADMLVTGIPIDELTKDGETPNDKVSDGGPAASDCNGDAIPPFAAPSC